MLLTIPGTQGYESTSRRYRIDGPVRSQSTNRLKNARSETAGTSRRTLTFRVTKLAYAPSRSKMNRVLHGVPEEMPTMFESVIESSPATPSRGRSRRTRSRRKSDVLEEVRCGFDVVA